MSENTFDDLLFGSPRGTGQNNCYGWAIEYYRDTGDYKVQPGDFARAAGVLKTPEQELDLNSCSDIVKKALLDAKVMGNSLKVVKSTEQCPKGSAKIMAFLAPTRDYHWYRYHRDLVYRIRHPRSLADLAKEFKVDPQNVRVAGMPDVTPSTVIPRDTKVFIRNARLWSHKQGFAPDGPILKDACNRIIKDPRTACRKYESLEYTNECAAFCFTKNKNKKS